MRTKEEIFQKMTEEMPFQVVPSHKPYILEAMDIYAKQYLNLFDESLRILRDLAEHQNGAPLIKYEEEYEKTINEVWDFLEANET